jgi:hypothetical protein
MHCHQVIKLSDTLPAIALGKERTCPVHGVQVEFLMGGAGGRQQFQQRWGRSRGRGRMKGSQLVVRRWCIKRMSGKGGTTKSNVTTNQRIERPWRLKRMSGKGSTTRSNPITSQRIERRRHVKRMGGKGDALRGRDAP